MECHLDGEQFDKEVKENKQFQEQVQKEALPVSQESSKQKSVEDSEVQISVQEEDESSPYNSQITINDSSVNQMITVLLEPGQSIWYCGQIVASNRPYFNQDNQGLDNFDLDRVFHYLKMKWRVPMKLDNTALEMAYFCIRRGGGGGKILHLDSRIYKETFVFDMNKLLTINQDPLNYELDTLPVLPYLSKFKFKGPLDRSLCICIQASPGHLIYEKSLGELEKLYVGNAQIMAMSEKISVKRVGNCVALEGPGYVFMEAPIPALHPQMGKQTNQLVFFLTLMTLTVMLLIIHFVAD